MAMQLGTERSFEHCSVAGRRTSSPEDLISQDLESGNPHEDQRLPPSRDSLSTISINGQLWSQELVGTSWALPISIEAVDTDSLASACRSAAWKL